ncbi:MAG: ribosome small subunit-dependent GTPase A [Gammaproteobacteria bacterium]|nr:ribosome small subunit-dependent GTPase A [Gammaproteobacteria bacterium]
MARRRLSQHQKKRLSEAQLALTGDSKAHSRGLVISHHGGKVVVERADQSIIECIIKSNLGTIVCGDRVIYEQNTRNEFRVLAVQPRENLLQRIDGFGHVKSVAANITQLFICLAVKPEPNLFLLDQYLLVAEQQGITPVIVLNKIDLFIDENPDPFRLETIYARLGYKILRVSTRENQGMVQLKSLFDNNTSVLVGVSGVGKSSITAALLPELTIKVAEISPANEEGRHTTRTSRLYHLPNQGNLIDTPGVRGFKPRYDPAHPITSGFREISELGEGCRFTNCRHVNEPKCEVLKAVKDMTIDEGRYQHYVHMLAEQSA